MRRTIAVLMCAMLVFSGMIVVVDNGTGAPAAERPYFSGDGSGTAGDPYLITTVEQLQEMGDDLAAYYALANDIDASGTAGWNDNGTGGYYGFDPIGDDSNAFTGSFDGRGYTINDLYINRPGSDYVGLFTWSTPSSSVSNVTLADVDVTGGSYTGAIMGWNEGTVNYSTVSGKVVGASVVGGVVGYNLPDATVSYSQATGNVTGTYYVGGLVGLNDGDGIISYSNADTVAYASEYYAGGLVGYDSGGHIHHSYAKGTVTAAVDCVGGLVGESDGNISDTYSSAEVNGQSFTGGLVGWNHGSVSESNATGNVGGTFEFSGGFVGRNDGNVSKCYSTGNVAGYYYVGGFAGENGDIVDNSYSTGSVTRISGSTSTEVGGFVGYNWRASIINCYSTGQVTYEDATDPTDKGFAGAVYTGGSYHMSGNFWDTETSLQTSSAGSTDGGSELPQRKTTAEMMQQATFTNWDFTNTWHMAEGLTYPLLQWQPLPGTAGNPFLIHNVWELQNMTNNLTAHYALANDIDASITSGWNGGEGFIPAGPGPWDQPANHFTGTFDGRGYEITNLYINRSTTMYNGLFGVMGTGSSVENLGMVNYDIIGAQYNGGIAGFLSNGSIYNTYATGNLTAMNEYAYSGGLVGHIRNSSTISDSFTSVTLNGYNNLGHYLGGLVGSMMDSSIFRCYATGSVNGGNRIGGLVGCPNGVSTITDSYATGSVTGGASLGGFIGQIEVGGVTVARSYATGAVSGTGNYIGGFVGRNFGTVSDSFWDTETGGPDNGIGTGKTTAEMMQQATFTNWDFTDVWGIDEGISYPYLLNFQAEEDDSMVASWPLDEGAGQWANDTSGNDNNGTLGSTAGADANDPAWVSGISGTALDFNGTSDYVNIPDMPELNPTDAITVEAWMKVTGSTGDHQVLVTKWYDDGGEWEGSYVLEVDPDGISPRWTTRINGVTHALISDITVPMNEWAYVVGTYDGAQKKLYVNGENHGTHDVVGTLTTCTNDLRFGSHNIGGDHNWFNGAMDEVSIWSRALNASEVLDRFNALAPVHNVDTGEHFTTIQAAIDDADTLDGHTIVVENGTYNENVVVNKTLTIRGFGKDNTTIDAGGATNGILVTASWVNITNLNVTKSSTSGIRVDDGAFDTHIWDCIVSFNDDDGIYIREDRAIIEENEINYNGGNGVCIWYNDWINVENNTIMGNIQDGIHMSGASRNHISHNDILDNGREGVDMDIDSTKNNLFFMNNILNNDHGIDLYGCDYNTFINNNISFNNQEGIIIRDYADYNDVIGNEVYGNTEAGIYYSGSYPDYAVVENNMVCNNGNQGIQMDSNSPHFVANNTVLNNSGVGIYMFSDSATVTNNTVWGSGSIGLNFNAADNIEAYGNTIYGNAGNGLMVNNAVGVHVHNNTIYGNTGNGLMVVNNAVGAHVHNNTIFDNLKDGIILTQGGEHRILNNTIVNNGLSGLNITGSDVADSELCLIDGNNVSYNNWNGIVLYDRATWTRHVYSTTITNNLVVGNNRTGIYMVGGTYSNVLRANEVRNNLRHGIGLDNAPLNTIFNNTIENNANHGMYVTATSNSRIYHNNFLGNAVQAYDSGVTNHWNASYPKGGNYWSDHSGTDAFSGANQDIPGSDGFGDAPYSVTGNQDNYPLMFQSVWWTEVAPTITLVSPQSGVAQSGTMLDFHVWDGDFDLDWANYKVDGGPDTAFGVNYDIDTTGWAEGEYSIEINAMDRSGNAAQETFNIRIDDTDPTLTVEISMSGDVNGNGFLDTGDTLTIWVNVTDANEDATTAPTVTVDETDFPGQAVSNLAYHGSGVWTCEYTVQAGGFNISSISVTFADKAGNSVTEIDAVLFRICGQMAMSLTTGWNLISFPMDEPVIDGFRIRRASDLANVSGATMVSFWNPVTQTYINYIPGFHLPSDPENFEIKADDGVFIYSHSSINIISSGYKPVGQRSIDLVTGWNIVGYHSMDVGDVEADWAWQVECGDKDDICYYDGNTFVHYIFSGTVMELTPGRAYYVWSDDPVTLVY